MANQKHEESKKKIVTEVNIYIKKLKKIKKKRKKDHKCQPHQPWRIARI